MLHGNPDSDAVLDSDQQAKDRKFAEQVFHQAVDYQESVLGCKWPDGTRHVRDRLCEEFPNYYWTIIRFQENNLNIDQPQARVYVMLWRDFIAMGFSLEQ